MQPSPSRQGLLGVIEDAAMRVCSGRIDWLGPMSELPKVDSSEDVIDACNAVILPGFIDCHTHLVHGDFRMGEFNERSKGKTYKEIAATGGGIMTTVHATRNTSISELQDSAKRRLLEALSYGTTTIEIKTGYGLDVKNELKMADVISYLTKENGPRVLGTFLGAHVVPDEFKNNRSEYIKILVDELIPSLDKVVMKGCDVFVEENAFSKDEAIKIADAAQKLNLKMHLHVDQFGDVGGGELSAELCAINASHLDYTSEEGLRAMKNKNVTAVLLPGASFFAGRGHYPNARKMIDAGLNVAVATDYNPGTNPSLNILLAATVAVTQMGLSCDEALMAITKNAATALELNDCGVIAEGKRADFILFNVPHEHFLLYRYGVNFVDKVFVGGRSVLAVGAGES